MARQIDILMRANEYLRKLDCGTDPLSGKKLPPFSAARETDVRKLLHFCSNGLVSIINYDNTDNRPAFSVTPEQAARLRPAPGSVNTSDLAWSITRVVDLLHFRGVNETALTSWLVEAGYLQKTGPRFLIPTKKGRAIGISPGVEGGFIFDTNAQQVVIDRVQEMADFLRRSTRPVSPHKRPVHAGATQGHAAGMRRLSEGLHPFSGAPLDERDPLTQERLKKCFDFTAWALERSVEAGYFTAKAPFSLPQERWKEIEIKESATLGEFIRNVNALLPDPTAVRGLAPAAVRDYLKSQGLLHTAADDEGRTLIVPTPAGNALGIVLGEATNDNGTPYAAMLYNAAAQRYLAERIGEIIGFAAGKG